ncbi:TetR/AcrR family transcriptional regulator [Microbacterium lacticum]
MRSTGRPRATSREVIAEAATELFLEQGFAATTVADITRRAGVSRSSFFNYFGSKADVLWAGFDARLDAACASLSAGAEVDATLRRIATDFTPDSLALAVVHADAMGIAGDLLTERAVRQARLARAVVERRRADGIPPLAAEVEGAALSGAVLAAVWEWAGQGPGRTDLASLLAEALALAPSV